MKLHEIQQALEALGVWEAIRKASRHGGFAISGAAVAITRFISLIDTPDSYIGQAGKIVRVKGDETGLEFAVGAGGAVDSVNGQLGVVVLDTDDLVDTSTNRYTNDTDITRLANTSGNNTGDQDLSAFETTTQLNVRDAANRDRANHTGTQTALTISDLQTTVSGNSDVSANTAARHTHPNLSALDNVSGINTGDQDLSPYALISSISAVGLSNDYNDLDNLPILGTMAFENSADYTPTIGLGDLALLDAITASLVTDFDTEVSNNTDVAANTAARHDLLTLGTNPASALSLSGQQLSLADVFVQKGSATTITHYGDFDTSEAFTNITATPLTLSTLVVTPLTPYGSVKLRATVNVFSSSGTDQSFLVEIKKGATVLATRTVAIASAGGTVTGAISIEGVDLIPGASAQTYDLICSTVTGDSDIRTWEFFADVYDLAGQNQVLLYRGLWNASTNSPTLIDGTGSAGDIYRVEVAGTIDIGSGSQTYAIGDAVVYNGTIWQKSTGADYAPLSMGVTNGDNHDHSGGDGAQISHASLSNLTVTDYHTQYLFLAGRSGGQTVVGGTGTTDQLIFKNTSGIGTTGADMKFLVGDNGATDGIKILNSGLVVVGDLANSLSELSIEGVTTRLALTATSDSGEFHLVNGGTNAGHSWYFTVGGDQWILKRDSADLMVFNNAGQMTVKNAAAVTLYVDGGASASMILDRNATTDASNINFRHTVGVVTDDWIIGTGVYRPGTDFQLGDGSAEKLTILTSSGFVGILNTAPSTALGIGGATATLTFGSATSESGPFAIAVLGSGGATPATKGTGYGRNLTITAGASDNTAGRAGGDVYLRGGVPVSPSTAYGNVIMADQGGAVGIGMTNPTNGILEVAGNAYFSANVSALSYTDRTPYFEGDALAEIMAIKGRNGKIDHTTLPQFAVVKKMVNEKEVQERDLGAMISILTVSMQQLIKRVEKYN